MTDAPKREQWWWTLDQVKRSEHHDIHGGSDNTVRFGDGVWKRDVCGERMVGFISTESGTTPGVLGAWLPWPPPPEEMSDRALRDVACRLRALADAQREHDVIGETSAGDMKHASEIIEAALEWDNEVERYRHAFSAERRPHSANLHYALRRRPK